MNSNPLPHTDVAVPVRVCPSEGPPSFPEGSAYMNFGAPHPSGSREREVSPRPRSASCDEPSFRDRYEELRRDRDALQAKLDRLAAVIGCENPAKIEHDLRNVMNELVLLRKLAEEDD